MGRVVEPVIGAMPRRADGRGRPWRDRRGALNGSLWILRTRARWADLPARARLVRRVLEALAADLNERGASSRSRHASATARLSPPKRGGCAGKAKRGTGAQRMGTAHGHSAWRWPTVLVFLAPCVPPRLRLARWASSPPPSTRG